VSSRSRSRQCVTSEPIRSGIYYLLPAAWSPGLNETYVFDETDQIRIELLGAEPAS